MEYNIENEVRKLINMLETERKAMVLLFGDSPALTTNFVFKEKYIFLKTVKKCRLMGENLLSFIGHSQDMQNKSCIPLVNLLLDKCDECQRLVLHPAKYKHIPDFLMVMIVNQTSFNPLIIMGLILLILNSVTLIAIATGNTIYIPVYIGVLVLLFIGCGNTVKGVIKEVVKGFLLKKLAKMKLGELKEFYHSINRTNRIFGMDLKVQYYEKLVLEDILVWISMELIGSETNKNEPKSKFLNSMDFEIMNGEINKSNPIQNYQFGQLLHCILNNNDYDDVLLSSIKLV